MVTVLNNRRCVLLSNSPYAEASYNCKQHNSGWGLIAISETFYDLAGGKEGMQRLATAFYRYVFDDPLMLPLFHDLGEDHIGRMALWLGEFFGGPTEHTEQRGGFQTVVAVHEPLNISDAQRDRWINYMMAACEEINMPEQVIDFFTPHIYSGALTAQRHSRHW